MIIQSFIPNLNQQNESDFVFCECFKVNAWRKQVSALTSARVEHQTHSLVFEV